MGWTGIGIIVGLVIVAIAGALLVNRINRRVRAFSQKLEHVLHSYQLTDEILARWANKHLKKLDQEAQDILSQAEALPSHMTERVRELRERLAKFISPENK